MAKVIPELSVVIVSYNTKDITSHCIASIYEHTKNLNFEVIVVDNNSHDGSVEALKKLGTKYPTLTVIPQKDNPGFGIANNIGAAKAQGDYLLFLNSDTLLEDNNLNKCLDHIKRHAGVGALSCRLNNTDGTPQSNGGYFPNIANVFAWQTFIDDLPVFKTYIKSIHPKPGFYLKTHYQDWITGAYFMIKKSLFEEIQGFDQNIFMYGEDLDLGYKLRNVGKKIEYLGTEHIIHLGNASGGSSFALTNEAKNLVYVYGKYHSKSETQLIKTILKLGALLRWAVFGIIQQDERLKKTYHEILVNL